MANTPVKAVLYTQRADRALATKVEHITSKAESFATNFMGRVEDGKDAACTRLVAIRDLDTNLWEIKRQTRLSGDERGITLHKTEALTGLCFFDALHYLARFQTTEADIGKQPFNIAGEGFSDTQHYTEAAKEAGQAIDADGEVHPCVRGYILTDGYFDDAAIKAAASTKNASQSDTPVPARTNFVASLNEGLMKKADNDDKSATDLAALSVNRRKVINQLKDVRKCTENFINAFRTAIANDFKLERPGLTATFGTISLGIVPAILYARGDAEHAPVRAVHKTLADLRSATEKLPDCAEKSMMQEFNRAAEYAFPMERAAIIYELCQKQKMSAEKINKGLPFIDQAASLIGLSDVDRGRLRSDYLAGKVESYQFYKKLQKELGAYYEAGTIYNVFHNKIEALEKDAPSVK